ncbi:MAG: type II secretion system protein [Candidatus Saganbacteria bacterium]|nr:type II secretion system protein [Candidatus Saganbacteria bacterium]
MGNRRGLALRSPRKRTVEGYTLIEIIIGMVLLVIIVYGLGIFIIKGIDVWNLLRQRNALQAESRRVIVQVLDEVRKIPDTNNILVFDPIIFEFNNIDGENHNYTFDAVGGNLFHNGVSLSDNLTANGLLFTYLDVFGNPTAVRDDIRAIRVEIKFERGAEIINIQSAVRLRVI